MSIIEASARQSDELDPDDVATCPLHNAELIAVVRQYMGISTHYSSCRRITSVEAEAQQSCLQHHFSRAIVAQVWNNPGLYEIYVWF